jgi:catechol 2,3-dioxygenase-like lactoylglutathione lyase family enzyme
MQIERIDHLVLTVRDIKVTCEFYARALGLHVVTFDNKRKALQFGQQKINLHQAGKEFEPKSALPTPGSADVCFITRVPLGQVIEHLRAQNVSVIEGPVGRTGALGAMESVYLRDPDGNMIEISNYADEIDQPPR